MVVKARRTVRIPLRLSEDDRDSLHATHAPYQDCQNETVDYCWPDRPKRPGDLSTSKGDAEAALYYPLREQTDDLHSNLVQKAIKDAVSAVNSCQSNWTAGRRVSKPHFGDGREAEWTMHYDKRAATYSRYKVSLATVDGRVEARYVLPAELEGTPYSTYVLDHRWSFATSTLVYDGERFWLHASMHRSYTTVPTPTIFVDADVDLETPEDTIRVLGVDRNVEGSLAVTSTGGFYGNADALNDYRARQEALRGELQQTGTHAAHERIRTRRGQEWRHYDDLVHRVANAVVQDALRVEATHVVFENLTDIRKRISNLPKFQQWLFSKLSDYVEYKLEPYGVEVDTVNPAYTSQGCSRPDCECVSEHNRQDKTFECVECGYAVDADYNAARNIGLRYLEEHSPASHTRSSGWVTSQLALMSGTLTPAGTFVGRNWESTDKPTTSVVGH
ncbi:transposase [Halarchaeum grantii]|uniref:Transposase n=1 Tax=Halarchaeum grantii TaxID=1193105 RepID=A0A830FE84_9EURY|nr:RNA-guided endonuclease TnpB family protein [Halarchaeum grantii]GGL44860.1 transposase [Halarchaeum grantii]